MSVSMEEKMRLLMDYRMQQMADWREVALEICELYTCERCYNSICCTVTPAALSDEELLRLSKHVGKKPEQFIEEYCDISEIGWIYLRSPCPFLKRGIKNRRYPVCRIHEIRPLVCRRYPFDDLPGVLNSTDLCPMASKIEEDIKDIQRRLSTGELKVEFADDGGLEEKMNKLGKEVFASEKVKRRLGQLGLEPKGFEDTMRGIIKKIAPNISGLPARNIKVHPGLFFILLEEKRMVR